MTSVLHISVLFFVCIAPRQFKVHWQPVFDFNINTWDFAVARNCLGAVKVIAMVV